MIDNKYYINLIYSELFKILAIIFVFFLYINYQSFGSTFSVESDLIIHHKNQTIAKENVVIENSEYRIFSDFLLYDSSQNSLTLKDNVIVEKKLTNEKYFADNIYILLHNHNFIIKNINGKINHKGYFIAEDLSSNENKFYTIDDINCSLCSITNGETPIWRIRAKNASVSLNNNKVYLKKVYFDIFNKRIFYLPKITVPYTGGKTGILIPKIQHNKIDGAQLALPFYLKIKDNFDVTFTPLFGKKITYSAELRQILCGGEYKIHTHFLGLHLKKFPIYLSIDSNFRANTEKHYEFGTNGNIALGHKKHLLDEYNVTHGKNTAFGSIYSHLKTNNSYLSGEIITIQHLKKNSHRYTGIPKIDLYHITSLNQRNFSNQKIYFKSFISANKVHFKTSILNDVFANMNFSSEEIYNGQIIQYQPNIFLHHTDNDNIIKPGLDIKWRYLLIAKNKPLIVEPTLGLSLQTTKRFNVKNTNGALASISTMNNIMNVNSIFSNGNYVSNRSIYSNGKALIYGLSISNYNIKCLDKCYFDNKINFFFGGRSNINNKSPFKNNKHYVTQISLTKQNLMIQNKTWFIKNNDLTQIESNELDIEKTFSDIFSVDLNYTFRNKILNIQKSDKKFYKNFINTNIHYDITNKLSLIAGKSIKFNKIHNDMKLNHIKVKLEYENDCAKIGFSIKHRLGKKTSWQVYFKIPDAKI